MKIGTSFITDVGPLAVRAVVPRSRTVTGPITHDYAVPTGYGTGAHHPLAPVAVHCKHNVTEV